MSIPKRIYRIGKAYLDDLRDRIDDALAEKELDAATREAELPDLEDASPDAMMRRAQARIDAARRELEAEQARQAKEKANAPGETAHVTTATATTVNETTAVGGTTTLAETDPNARDYKVLGLPVGSDLPAVVTKYEELIHRCDPRRFPDGSEEQETAKQILARVNLSYDALRKRLDPTENRFSKIEF